MLPLCRLSSYFPHCTILLVFFCKIEIGSSSSNSSADSRKSHPVEFKISTGSIRGELVTLDAQHFTVFKGIPYAAPPVGVQRFQPPVQPASWRGVMNATRYAPCCTQVQRGYDAKHLVKLAKLRLSEDCLYLNVFAPLQYGNETHPIIVWIHGGDFQVGSASDYKQEAILRNFVSRQVVFVSMNYRLGPLGFASTGDDVMPGNNGLWDQIEALRWVQINIHNFGGDPKRVTVMGHGSGAASASLLAISPRTEGLVHGAVLLSGSAFNPGMVRSSAINATWLLQKHLGCRAFNSSHVLECLRLRRRKEILDESRPRIVYDNFEDWLPIVDGYDGVIPESPMKMFQDKRARKVPIIIGTSKDECAMQMITRTGYKKTLNILNEQQARHMITNLTMGHYEFNNNQLITEGCLYDYVYSLRHPDQTPSTISKSLIEMLSNFYFHAPAVRFAENYEQLGTSVYLYSFDHISDSLFGEDDDWKGVFHGTDLIFLFDLDVEFAMHYSYHNWQLDRRVTEIFSEMITNFAETKNPTPGSSDLTKWNAFNRTLFNYLSISDNPQMKNGFHWRGNAFWNRYAMKLDAVDVGNLRYIGQLNKNLENYQLSTWVLLSTTSLFAIILIGLAFYCTRKDSDESEV